MTSMLLIAIAIVVFCTFVMQLWALMLRLERIISLQIDQRDALTKIVDLLEVPYRP
jgi:hypothetical protein